MLDLSEIGLGPERLEQMANWPGLVPARVIAGHRGALTLLSQSGETPGRVDGVEASIGPATGEFTRFSLW